MCEGKRVTAPTFAEGRVKLEDREGGNLVIATFRNGASIILSRHDLFAASRDMLNHSCKAFEAQPADILRLHAKR